MVSRFVDLLLELYSMEPKKDSYLGPVKWDIVTCIYKELPNTTVFKSNRNLKTDLAVFATCTFSRVRFI